MKTTLARAAVVAATRIVRDGTPRPDLVAEVVEAHQSIYDADPDQSSMKARTKLLQAANLAGDLVNFGMAVRGGRNG